MREPSYPIGLIVTTALVLGAGLGFVELVGIWQHVGLFVASVAFFVQLSIIVHWLARRASRGTDPYAFVRIIMGNMLVKLVAAVVIVVVYTRTHTIDTSLFILPFFISYLGYTIFEIYYLNHLSRRQ